MATVQWLGLRAVVGAGAFAAVLALAQVTFTLLISAYSNVAPYTGS